MDALKARRPRLAAAIGLFLPLGLWGMLVLSLQAGDIKNIGSPGDRRLFLEGLRAALPLAAATVAMFVLLAKMLRRQRSGIALLGPLSLAALYGLVGIVASLRSIDRPQALYWTGAYLSVPLVLWAIVWGGDSLGQVRRLINLNWLIVFLLVAALFALGMVKLDLSSVILSPSSWIDCKPHRWLDLSGHFIRDTGVGRYAAMAGIISISLLWQRSWRILGGLALVASVMLLLYSGARTALVGFGVAAPLTVLLYGGRRALVAGGLALLVVAPVLWGTGVSQSFLSKCILRESVVLPKQSEAPVLLEVPPGNSVLKEVLPREQGSATVPAQISLATGKWALQKSSSPQTSGSEATHSVPIRPGEWVLQPSPCLPAASSAQTQSSPPASVLVPPGKWVLVRVSSQEHPAADSPVQGGIPEGFFTFTGRTTVWAKGWELFTRSPWLGFGFHADRLLLGTHMHNTLLHALIQTGIIGTIPFMAALLYGWVLLYRATRKLKELPIVHKHLVIQTGGILAFLSVRAVPESTGAFFGVDWLFLAPLLLYLQVLNTRRPKEAEEIAHSV